VAALLGFVSAVAFVLGVGLIISDVRQRRRVARRRQPHAGPPTVVDEVANWLRDQG
jgi:hypothetical protein